MIPGETGSIDGVILGEAGPVYWCDPRGRLSLFSGVILGEAGSVAGVILGEAGCITTVVPQGDWRHDRGMEFRLCSRVACGHLSPRLSGWYRWADGQMFALPGIIEWS